MSGGVQEDRTQPPTAYGGPFNVLKQPSDSGTTHMSIVDGKFCSSCSSSSLTFTTVCDEPFNATFGITDAHMACWLVYCLTPHHNAAHEPLQEQD